MHEVYILTPVLYYFAVDMYLDGVYIVSLLALVVGVLSTVWIIWYQRVGKKFEERVHKVVYEDIGGQTEAFVDETGIIFNNKSIGYVMMNLCLLYGVI